MAEHVLSGKEAVMKALEDIAKRMGGGEVSVGFMGGTENGTPIPAIAFWNEFGHEGNFPAPPRPFFRNMIAKDSPEWPERMAGLAKATNLDGEKVLKIMGESIKDALDKSIIDLTEPALSPTTLRLREVFGNSPEKIRARDVLQAQKDVQAGETIASGTHAKPLIWTSNMKDSITFKVEKT